ncbi:MAG TPA: hypothetical protein VMA36_04805 [Candidatus Limnocylindria bacterium]|nr:hypothetical protein [Candidatus Limnocylindria bacterium]
MRSAAILTGVGLLGAGGVMMVRAMRGRNGSRIEKAFTIERPAAELYAAWHDPEQLPSIISILDRVEIVADEADRSIAWRGVGCQPTKAGSVTFTRAPGDRGTELRVTLEPRRPSARLALAARVENDLRRFKAKLEAGDVALNGTDVTS